MKLPLVFVLGVVGIAVSFNQRMLDPLTTFLARQLAVDPAWIVMLSPIFLLPYALGQPFLGPLADAIGKAKVLRTCVGILILATLASVFVTDYTTLAVLRFITGLAAGGCIPVGLALIADRTPANERQVAFSRFMIAMTLGQLITAPISAWIAVAADWHGVLLLAVAIALGALALLLWQIKPNPAIVRKPFSAKTAATTYRAILSVGRARLCYAAVLAEGLFVFGFIPHLALHLEKSGMGSITEAGYALAALGFGGLSFAAVVPMLVRRFGPYQLMAAGGLLLGLGLSLAALAPTWQAISGALLIVGFAFYLLHSGLQTQVTEVMTEARSSVVSLHAFSMFIGLAAGPLIFGWLEAGLGFSGALLLSAVAITGASLAAVRLLSQGEATA
jgi:YNFM family putative membrane transporter